MALPPEKTDGVCSGDEKKAEKESDTRTGSKKQLKFEVSPLYFKFSLYWYNYGRKITCGPKSVL